MSMTEKLKSYFKTRSLNGFGHGGEGRHPAERPGFRSLRSTALNLLVAVTLTAQAVAPAFAAEPHNGQALPTIVRQMSYTADLAEIAKHPASTAYSDYVARMQKTFEDVVPGMKIIIFDRDMMRLAIHHGAGKADSMSREQLVDLVVRDRAYGFALPPKALKEINEALDGPDSKAWLYVNDMFSAPRKEHGIGAACMVVTGSPNTTARADAAFLMSVMAENITQVGNTPGKIDLSKDMLQRYFDLREIGKCFDPRDIMTAKSNFGPDGHWAAHRSEAFGDIFASLLLAKAGYRDFAGKLADMRTVGSAVVGPLAVGKRGGDFVRERWMGAIMSDQRALYEVQTYINNTPKEVLEGMGFKDIVNLSKDFREKYALSDEEFSMVHAFYSRKERRFVDEKKVGTGVAIANREFLNQYSDQAKTMLNKMVDREVVITDHGGTPRKHWQQYVATTDRAEQSKREAGVDTDWRRVIEDAGTSLGGGIADVEKVIAHMKDTMRAGLAKSDAGFTTDGNTLDKLDTYMSDHRYQIPSVRKMPASEAPSAPSPDKPKN
jgi:hypothetical protein